MSGSDKTYARFTSDGKLHQINYAFKAMQAAGMTSVGVRGEGCVVTVTLKKAPDTLIDRDTVTYQHRITDTIGAAVTGLTADGLRIIQWSRNIALNFRQDYGYEIPPSYLARELADIAQVIWQRPLAVSVLFSGIDDELGPQLFKVELSGAFAGYEATCTGQRELKGQYALVKRLKDQQTTLTDDETIRIAIGALQNVLQENFKATDVEVGIVRRSNPRFTMLTKQEIDAHLTALETIDD